MSKSTINEATSWIAWRHKRSEVEWCSCSSTGNFPNFVSFDFAVIGVSPNISSLALSYRSTGIRCVLPALGMGTSRIETRMATLVKVIRPYQVRCSGDPFFGGAFAL